MLNGNFKVSHEHPWGGLLMIIWCWIMKHVCKTDNGHILKFSILIIFMTVNYVVVFFWRKCVKCSFCPPTQILRRRNERSSQRVRI